MHSYIISHNDVWGTPRGQNVQHLQLITVDYTKKSLHIYTHTHTIKLVQMSHLFDILNTFAQHREIQDN